jgi:hypothetical protein
MLTLLFMVSAPVYYKPHCTPLIVVWLETWVKVRGGRADDERAVKSLGY